MNAKKSYKYDEYGSVQLQHLFLLFSMYWPRWLWHLLSYSMIPLLSFCLSTCLSLSVSVTLSLSFSVSISRVEPDLNMQGFILFQLSGHKGLNDPWQQKVRDQLSEIWAHHISVIINNYISKVKTWKCLLNVRCIQDAANQSMHKSSLTGWVLANSVFTGQSDFKIHSSDFSNQISTPTRPPSPQTLYRETMIQRWGFLF